MIGWSVAIGAAVRRSSCSRSATSSRALFTSDPAVIAKANEIWPLFALMMPFNGAVFALDGILIGAGDTRFLMWGMLAAAAVYIPIALLALRQRLGHRRRVVGARRADRRPAGHVRRAVRGHAGR